MNEKLQKAAYTWAYVQGRSVWYVYQVFLIWTPNQRFGSDFMSESLLATASGPAATSKVKTIELYNPTIAVELKFIGTLSFKWAFQWEECVNGDTSQSWIYLIISDRHEFEWKREECYMIRKPDPPVLVAITKEPAGRLKSSSIQLLDYNLNRYESSTQPLNPRWHSSRFDINDRKGLEIVILTALLTFHDYNDIHHTAKGTQNTSPTPTPSASAPVILSPPTPPPRPEPKIGADRIAEMQAIRGEFNEVTVEAEGSVADYAAYCWNLLQVCDILSLSTESWLGLNRMMQCCLWPLNPILASKSRKWSKSSKRLSEYGIKQVKPSFLFLHGYWTHTLRTGRWPQSVCYLRRWKQERAEANQSRQWQEREKASSNICPAKQPIYPSKQNTYARTWTS